MALGQKHLCLLLVQPSIVTLLHSPCKSLFEQDKTFASAHGVDLDAISSRLSPLLALDPYQRIRLINWIRKRYKPAPSEVLALKGHESLFASDEYLIPVIEDDPLLHLEDAKRRIRALGRKLQKARQDFVDYRAFVGERLGRSGVVEALAEPAASTSTHIATPLRDDDSHYFQSYGENDIHAVMIQDKVRTATYAQFIQSSPELFHDAVVLDVGCGTGILSLFAARAGARRVIAVDASPVVEKAQQIVRDNGLEDVITVVRGRVEDIQLPEGVESVDVIVSEWMGYGLLYESMLDSVLHARDRFLKKEGGVMAPSQCKMQLCLCEGGEIFKERIGFWSDVYGFDLSAMGTNVYEDAIVDVVGPEAVLSEPCTVKDLHLASITPKQLDFSAPFTLTATSLQRTKAYALTLYFDTFFTADGAPAPPDAPVHVVRDGDPILAEVWPLGWRPHTGRRMSSGQGLKNGEPAKRRVTSFTTGPASVPTHWKQTIFLLREPITVHEGTVVQGTFKCHKSTDNSRELDVEIHYTVKDPDEAQAPGKVVVQLYKVR
ncbi:S-adenosyl-L-methionine-dependent methyltransferase [Fomitopsis serialis]|uniref:S-adenosyl-L-methionine-dependent methyltransferase n=1 Tax=Fomitopsis serialis TaxID=139415 RepID=UPI0020079D29|nr:S-adenosyl-L-methionine-dependent methyltransferase [Neoantrodia serialis]KAH9922941.1 S-adenosyl-L-methionine-dependent methyltransferase [Neoantrodia serialis]